MFVLRLKLKNSETSTLRIDETVLNFSLYYTEEYLSVLLRVVSELTGRPRNILITLMQDSRGTDVRGTFAAAPPSDQVAGDSAVPALKFEAAPGVVVDVVDPAPEPVFGLTAKAPPVRPNPRRSSPASSRTLRAASAG